MDVIKRLEAKQLAASLAASACERVRDQLTRFLTRKEGQYLMLGAAIDVAEHTGDILVAVMARKVITGTEDPENLFKALKATWYKQRCLERLCYTAAQYKRNPSDQNLEAYTSAYFQYEGIEV